jgi:hypothetical protein
MYRIAEAGTLRRIVRQATASRPLATCCGLWCYWHRGHRCCGTERRHQRDAVQPVDHSRRYGLVHRRPARPGTHRPALLPLATTVNGNGHAQGLLAVAKPAPVLTA